MTKSTTSDQPFAGCISMLEDMIGNGTIDRFNDSVERRLAATSPLAKDMVMTVYLDGTFVIQTAMDGAYDAMSVPDFVTNIDLNVLKDEIRKANN